MTSHPARGQLSLEGLPSMGSVTIVRQAPRAFRRVSMTSHPAMGQLSLEGLHQWAASPLSASLNDVIQYCIWRMVSSADRSARISQTAERSAINPRENPLPRQNKPKKFRDRDALKARKLNREVARDHCTGIRIRPNSYIDE